MTVIDDVLKVFDEHPEGLDFSGLREATGLGHTDLDQVLGRLEREELIVVEEDNSYRKRGPLDAGRTRVEAPAADEEEGEEEEPDADEFPDAPPMTPPPPDAISVVDRFHEEGKAANVFVVLRADGESLSMWAESEADAAKAVLHETKDDLGIAVCSLADMHRWRTKRELERDGEDVEEVEVAEEGDVEAKDGTLLSFMGQVQCRNQECDDNGHAWDVRFTREQEGDPEDLGLTDWSNEVGAKTCASCGRDGNLTEDTRERMEFGNAEEEPAAEPEVEVEVTAEPEE